MELLEGPFVEAGHAPVGKAVSYFFEYLDNWKSGWLVDHGGKCYLVVAYACHGPSGVDWDAHDGVVVPSKATSALAML